MKKRNNLQKDYEKIVNKYLTSFFDKQELYEIEDGKKYYPTVEWIGSIGEICEFCDYYFSFDKIKYDVDNNCPKGAILEWYSHTLEYAMNKKYGTVNYQSYLMGVRCEKLPTKFQKWYALNKWRWCRHKWELKDHIDFSYEMCNKCGKSSRCKIKEGN